MKRRNAAIAAGAGAAALAAAIVIAILVVRAVRETPADRSRRTAVALLAGMEAAVERAIDLREPFRCARFENGDADPPPPRVVKHGGATYEVRGDTLAIEGDRELVIAVVADARGANPATLEQLGALRRELTEAGVELVLSLGGHGREPSEIARVLSALALDAPWVVVAMPGDREALPAHRAAVDQVSDGVRGVVFDGSQVRFIEHGSAVIATFPGVEHGSQVVAGTEGCVHTAEDAGDLAAALADRDRARIVASFAPPRQRGPGASDLTRDGIHVGEQLLAEAVDTAKPVLVVHGLVEDGARATASGEQRAGGEPAVVGAGSLEAAPDPLRHRTVTSAALIARITADRVRWRRLVLHRQR